MLDQVLLFALFVDRRLSIVHDLYSLYFPPLLPDPTDVYFKMVCDTMCGMSTDSLCAYQSVKVVSIKDRRLGCLKYFLFFLMAMLVGGYHLIYQCLYLKFEAPVGTVRFSLREPTVNNCDPIKTPSCLNIVPSIKSLPYCEQSTAPSRYNNNTNTSGCAANGLSPGCRCIIWDSIEAKNVQDRSVLVTTRVLATYQNRTAQDDCVDSTCTHIWTDVQSTDNFIGGIDNFTLQLDHTVQSDAIENPFSAKSMQGSLRVAKGGALCKTYGSVSDIDSTCHVKCKKYNPQASETENLTVDPDWPCKVGPTGLDYFSIGTLLEAAEVTLEDSSDPDKYSYRQYGMVVQVDISYRNWKNWIGTFGSPTYDYNLRVVPGSSYKFESATYPDDQTRLVKTKFGIRLAVLQTGQLGVFSFATMMIEATTMITYLALATLVVDFLATSVLKQKVSYRPAKIQDLDAHGGHMLFSPTKPINDLDDDVDLMSH
eukprot:m.137380 g.137380  ORF g.137380 m.137380 type:complete len:482 (+) comp29918_c0_seq1:211-1656(+)